MAGIEHGNVTNEEFMEEVGRYECVYNRNSKNLTFPLNEMYGYSRLCDRLRSSIWKQLSLRSSAIIWKPALRSLAERMNDLIHAAFIGY